MDYIKSILSLQAEISLVIILVILLAVHIFVKLPNYKLLRNLSCVLMVVQILLNIVPLDTEAFGGMYRSTEMVSVMKTVLSVATLLVFLQSSDWLARIDTRHKVGEFYVLTLSTLLGMFFMVSAGSFIIFYVGVELASIPMACLISMDKLRGESAEAGAKFILSSMFSSALMLYGLSFIYGTSGTTYFADITPFITGTPLQVMALVFFFAGLGFKLSLVPFHMWTPDTYQGAPTSVSAYLSVVSKGAAAFSLLVILVKVFSNMVEDWNLLLSIVIVVTITVANIFAILQSNLKRFMAYSSVSQAGYIMLAVMAGNEQGMTALVYYIIVYIVANVAVFGVINTVEQHTSGLVDRDSYNGLYKTNPKLTLIMTLALFSLAGIPPFAGFFSKFFVFASAFHAGNWLVVFLALVNTIISLYYYLLVVKAMYIMPNENPIPTFRSSRSSRLCLAICTAGVLLLGLCSGIYQLLSDIAEF